MNLTIVFHFFRLISLAKTAKIKAQYTKLINAEIGFPKPKLINKKIYTKL